jgi:membrane protein implicated in regulation of membrane protease activity
VNQKDTIQNAVNDLAVIRRAIEKAGNPDTGMPANAVAVDAGLLFQGICLLIATALIGFELISSGSMTSIMLYSAHDTEIGLLGLAQVAIVMATLVMCLYFIVWRASLHSEQGFQDYLVRNFQYLRNLSLVSDLLTKFIPLSLLVLAGHPEWVSPLLCLYIADYLVQGRFFSMPVRVSLALGIAALSVAVAQYLIHSANLVWPLVLFAALTAVSLLFLLRARLEHGNALQAG